MLTHWTRDRAHDLLPLEFVVNKMTAQTAALYGLGDRGALTPGMLGDVNVIDYDALQLPLPELVHDLPADARRFVQGSSGYVATVKRGTAILRNGEDQGARPGQLLRGARARRRQRGCQIISTRITASIRSSDHRRRRLASSRAPESARPAAADHRRAADLAPSRGAAC